MLMYILGIIAIILTVVFIVVRVIKGGIAGVYTKTIASIAFILVGLFGAYNSGLTLVSLFILLGLICGLLGDIVLDLKVVYKADENKHLNAGMLCFGVGHVCYFVALTIYSSNILTIGGNRTGALMLIALGVSLFITTLIMLFGEPLLKLNFGKFKIQTALYTFALSYMTAYSISAGIILSKLLIFAAGLFLIFVSDLILSNQYFGGKQDSKILTILNHAIYYLGQITIATMLYFI